MKKTTEELLEEINELKLRITSIRKLIRHRKAYQRKKYIDSGYIQSINNGLSPIDQKVILDAKELQSASN